MLLTVQHGFAKRYTNILKTVIEIFYCLLSLIHSLSLALWRIFSLILSLIPLVFWYQQILLCLPVKGYDWYMCWYILLGFRSNLNISMIYCVNCRQHKIFALLTFLDIRVHFCWLSFLISVLTRVYFYWNLSKIKNWI